MAKWKVIIIFILLVILSGCSAIIESSNQEDSIDGQVNKTNMNNDESNVKESSNDKEKTLNETTAQEPDLEEKSNEESNQIVNYKITTSNTENGEKTLNVEGMEIGDYLIDNNIAYLMLVDTYESPTKIEIVKYNLVDKQITSLLRKEYKTFINAYSLFIKKLNNDAISLDFNNEICVIDVALNVVKHDIGIPDNIMYADISYSGDKLCYYKNGNLYMSSIDFSNEKLLKTNVEDTEDSIQPYWSHDDSKIAYFNGYNIEVINLQGEVLESLPRHARYMKWSYDDTSLIVGYLGAYYKIDMKEKVIFSTTGGYDEYTEHGYQVKGIDVTSPDVVFESSTGVLAYKDFKNNVECYNFSNQLRLNTMEESIKNIRWSNKDNELVINYFNIDTQIDTIAFIDTQGNRFQEKQALKVVQQQKNLYVDDNHRIDDSDEWIISSEDRRGIVKMNLSTGEYETINNDCYTKTQPLKKWNYVWNHKGIYLLRYDGKESNTIVYTDESYIGNYHRTDDGLLYECKDTYYYYNFETMENKKIFQKDYYVWDVFNLEETIYIIGCELKTSNTKVIAYNIKTEAYEEIYRAPQPVAYKGFYNNTIYFDDKILNCLTGILASTIDLEFNVVEWKDKLYFTDYHKGIVGKTDNNVDDIELFDKNFSNLDNIWYFGDHLYLINYEQQLICQVNPDTLDVTDYVHMKSIEEYYKFYEIFLINNELIFQKDNAYYQFKQEELGSINLERIQPNKDSLYSNESQFLNARNVFENRGKYNDIAKIIQEPFNQYAYTEDYIAYTDNNDMVWIIERRTGNRNLVSNVKAHRVEIKGNNIFYQNRINGVFKYNLINGETHKILAGCIFQYEIVGDKIYYIDNYLNRTLYALDMRNNVVMQLSEDHAIVQDILVVGNALYYLTNKIALVIYTIKDNKSEYVKLLDIASIDKLFPLNSHEICFIHKTSDGFIMDTLSTSKGQIPNAPNDIIYENNAIVIFNTYLRCNGYGNRINGIYNKNTNILENTHLCNSIDEAILFGDWIYLIGTDFDARVVQRVNMISYEKEYIFEGEKVFISSDTKYLAGLEYDTDGLTFYNFETGEKRIMDVKITELKDIKDGYIYYEYEDEEYRCSIEDLEKSEKIQ